MNTANYVASAQNHKNLIRAYDTAADCRAAFARVIADVDALITPSAPGEAVMFEEGHGDPAFNVIWSALHAPVINLPGLTGPQGLPVGISLVGSRYADSRLLGIAEAMAELIDAG